MKKPEFEPGVNITLYSVIWDAVAILTWQEDEELAKFIFDQIADEEKTITIYGLTREEVRTILRGLRLMQTTVAQQYQAQRRYDYEEKTEEVKGA